MPLRLFPWLCALALLGAAPGAIAQLRLPDFSRQSYEPSKRDPVLDPAAPSTLVGGPVANPRAIAGGDSLKKLLRSMTEQIRSALVVGGVAFAADGSGRALVSDLDVTTGDLFVFPISSELNSQILGVMRTYNVEVRRVSLSDKRDALVLMVGRIAPDGVTLHLPGFPNPICILRYDPRLGLSARKITPPK